MRRFFITWMAIILMPLGLTLASMDNHPTIYILDDISCYWWSTTSLWSAKSVAGTIRMKFTDFRSKRVLNSYAGRSQNYSLDMRSRRLDNNRILVFPSGFSSHIRSGRLTRKF